MPFHEVAPETIEKLWTLHVPTVYANGFDCQSCKEHWPCSIVRWLEDRPSRWVDRNREGLSHAR